MSTIHVSVRLDEGTMARVDALAPLFSTHWRNATRSDVIRGLILSALEKYEREAVPPHPRGDVPAASRGVPARSGPPEAERQAPPGRKGVKASARKGKG
jgi:hypothetical protein